ncbi:cytochrome c biogenesis CcdA family protein [Parageobacillus thermoglucosidasius]|uniref:cytochrome c biogenesis CcdA family protein n=1 Tax=Parageobacillus thermoglucosidasius TaxID=1426 RepID=UPI0027F46A7D|nr:cytochrome c biogenesis protein CcdA [Parageobacillus thermoglucosidasius]
MGVSVGIVFSAGAVAAFNPCGVALLPAFIAYLMGGQEANWTKGVQAGIMMTLGFLSIFLPIGLLMSIFKEIIGSYLSIVVTIVGIFLIIAGLLMLFGRELIAIKTFQVKKGNNQAWSFYIYGIAYAITSLGCTLPVFSLTVLSALVTGDLIGGMIRFVAYALGMGLVVTAISVAAVISRQFIQAMIKNVTPFLHKASSLLLIGSGIYFTIKFWPF